MGYNYNVFRHSVFKCIHRMCIFVTRDREAGAWERRLDDTSTSRGRRTSRTHHRKGLFLMPSRIPKASGRNRVQVADSGGTFDVVPAGVWGETIAPEKKLTWLLIVVDLVHSSVVRNANFAYEL